MGRSVLGVRRVEHAGRRSRRALRDHVRRVVTRCVGTCPDRRCRHPGRPPATDGHRRARPGARRRHRRRVGHAARRRARHRQEHVAPAAAGLVAGDHAVRECRGERATGAPAGRAARRRAPRSVVAGGHRGARHRRRHRRDPPRPRGGRQHPGRRRPGARVSTRKRRAGAGVRAPVGGRGQAARHPRRHGRSRDQGRRSRRATRPRARGRHGVVVRGRPASLVAAAARHEASVRPNRRARVVRDGLRRSGGCARPERVVPRRPPHRRARISRRPDDRGQASDRRRGASAHRGRAVRRPRATHIAGHRRRAVGVAVGGPAAAGAPAGRQRRRLRVDGRWRAARRARARPRGVHGRRQRPHGPADASRPGRVR